jgi:drug/metabolite transporter (DMT)-like permease
MGAGSPFRWVFNQAWLLLSLTSLFWAGNAIVGRAVADSFPPATLAQLRWIGSALIVLPFAWPYLKRDAAAIRRHWLLLVVMSFTGISVFNTLQYWSLERTTAVNVLLLQASMPLLIGVTSFFVNGDRLTPAQLGGILISICGVAAIVSGGSIQTLLHLRLNPGDAVFVAALAVYTVYMALLKRRPAIHWLSFLAVTVVWGALLLLPVTALEIASGARPEITAGNGLALLYVMIFPSLIAYLCFNRGVELIGANRAGPFLHLVPLFGVVLSVTLLGEAFTWIHALGAALIAAGVLIASLPGRARAPAPPPE